jgi:hypothetical protein
MTNFEQVEKIEKPKKKPGRSPRVAITKTQAEKSQDQGIQKFESDIRAIETDISHKRALDDVLFSSKGVNQLEMAKKKIDDQKKNPRMVMPVTKVDTRSVPSTDPKQMQLRAHLNERVEVMITRANGLLQSIDFPLALLPGDPCYFWEIPVCEVISIPRGVALHLKNNCVWVKIDHREKTQAEKNNLPDLSLSTNIVVDSIHTDFNILDAKSM